MRVLALLIAGSCCAFSVSAATLERLSIDQMSQKSTSIVRGRITQCSGELRAAVIYTRCKVQVAERWKGSAGATLEFVVPGGTAAGLTQNFTGTPKFQPNEDYVLFLWTGRSGVNQVIGLSQGVFDLRVDAKGQTLAARAASSEVMLDAAGERVVDKAVEMRVADLRRQVSAALKEAR